MVPFGWHTRKKHVNSVCGTPALKDSESWQKPSRKLELNLVLVPPWSVFMPSLKPGVCLCQSSGRVLQLLQAFCYKGRGPASQHEDAGPLEPSSV